MNNLDKGYCLILGGGGVKGVYHLGVWKALRELGIEVEAFVGTSIGAIVAGFLAQGEGIVLENAADFIRLDSVIALPESFVEEGKLKVRNRPLSAVQDFFRGFIENKGLDTSPLRALLASLIDEGKIRNSGKDLGIVTIDLSDFKPRELFLDSMEEGTVIDYLMASAAVPGFQQPVIKGKKYIDGGVFDNVPYAMARQRGYRRLIISDVSGLGWNRRPEIEGSLTVYIKNSINMGGILDFDRRFMRDFERLGYLDTLRVFGKLKGYSYFIKPDAKAETAFLAGAQAAASAKNAVFPKEMQQDTNFLLKYLECAASILEVPRVELYRYSGLRAAIAKRKKEEERKIAKIAAEEARGGTAMVTMLREVVASGNFKGSPYYYYRLIEDFAPPAALPVLQKALVKFFPALPAGMEYLRRAN